MDPTLAPTVSPSGSTGGVAPTSEAVSVDSGGTWSLGYSLPATPVNMTADLVSAEPVEQVTAPTVSGTTGSSSLTQQKQQ